MILHTLNASPSSAAFRDCLSVIGEGDALVLMGDGVYAALTGTDAYQQLIDAGARLYLLLDDARLAGVPLPASACEKVSSIDMDGLVQLTEDYPRQQAWY